VDDEVPAVVWVREGISGEVLDEEAGIDDSEGEYQGQETQSQGRGGGREWKEKEKGRREWVIQEGQGGGRGELSS